jgi:hypothetical protein
MARTRRALMEQYMYDAVASEDATQTVEFEHKLDAYADAVRRKAIDDCVKSVQNVYPRAEDHG